MVRTPSGTEEAGHPPKNQGASKKWFSEPSRMVRFVVPNIVGCMVPHVAPSTTMGRPLAAAAAAFSFAASASAASRALSAAALSARASSSCAFSDSAPRARRSAAPPPAAPVP